MSAAGAVSGGDVVTFNGNLHVAPTVEEMVDRLVAVASRHDNGPRAEIVQTLGKITPRPRCPCKYFRLLQVRRDDGREWKQPPHQGLDRVVLQELCAGARDHHRIDDQWHVATIEEARDALDQLA